MMSDVNVKKRYQTVDGSSDWKKQINSSVNVVRSLSPKQQKHASNQEPIRIETK